VVLSVELYTEVVVLWAALFGPGGSAHQNASDAPSQTERDSADVTCDSRR
jgi:hypothetical protein